MYISATSFVTVDGTTTSRTFELPNTASNYGAKLQFGDVTGLTGTIAVSADGTAFFNILAITREGVSVPGGATHTATDGGELHFISSGWKFVKYTRTAGSGPVRLIQLESTEEYDSALGRSAAGPALDSYTTAAISASANTADQSVVAAPGANKQIWVYGWGGTADTADGTIAFQDEDNTAITGVMAVTNRGGFCHQPSGSLAMPVFKVATNKALEIDTVTCGFKGWIAYGIVSV